MKIYKTNKNCNGYGYSFNKIFGYIFYCLGNNIKYLLITFFKGPFILLKIILSNYDYSI